MSEVRVFWAIQIMNSSKQEAMEWTPEAEHEDIVPYVELSDYDALKAKHEELLSYLPKVPTEPYEKELAQKVQLAESDRDTLRRLYESCDARLEEAEKENAVLREQIEKWKTDYTEIFAECDHRGGRIAELTKALTDIRNNCKSFSESIRAAREALEKYRKKE